MKAVFAVLLLGGAVVSCGPKPEVTSTEKVSPAPVVEASASPTVTPEPVPTATPETPTPSPSPAAEDAPFTTPEP